MPIDPEVNEELTAAETLTDEARTSLAGALSDLTLATGRLAELRRLLTDDQPPPPPPTDPRIVNASATSTQTSITVSWVVDGDASRVDAVGIGWGREGHGFLGFTGLPGTARSHTIPNLVANSAHSVDILLAVDGDPDYTNATQANGRRVRVDARTAGNGNPPPPPPPGPTGVFRASQGVILDPDGRPFTPNGCNAVGGDSWSVWWGFNLHDSMEDMRRVYGMNFARWIHTERGDLAHHPWVGNIGPQDELVEQARQRRFCLMLTNFDNHPGNGPGLDIGWAVEKMSRLARRYADNPYVVYSPWNEPTEPGYGPADLNEWRRVTYPVVDAILAANPKAFVILGGDHYGQEASNQDVRTDSVLIQLGPELIDRYGDRVAGDIHVYARWWDQDRNDEDLRRYFRELKAIGLPIVVGETGALDSWPQEGLRQALDRLYRVVSESEFAHVGVAPWCNGWGDFINHSDHQWGSHYAWAVGRGFVGAGDTEQRALLRRIAAPVSRPVWPTLRQRMALAAIREAQGEHMVDTLVGELAALRGDMIGPEHMAVTPGPTRLQAAELKAQAQREGRAD
jgi:hypothetical protein